MEEVNRLKNLLKREIGETADREHLTPELIDGSLKAMCLLNEIQDYEDKMILDNYSKDYSRHNYYNTRYRDNEYSGAKMRSSVTGRYISSRDEHSNDGYYDNNHRDNYKDDYSGHDKQDLIGDLEMRAKHAKSDMDRQTIYDAIAAIKNN